MRPIALLLVVILASASEVLPGPILKLPPGEQPIQIASCSVTAQVRGILAEVRTELVFANPNPRQLAGDLEFPLPDGATVCGYALDVGGHLVDGVPVSQERARVVLETEQRRRVDPGIAEVVRGNLFRTRVFPLPAGGKRTVVITWAAPLASTGGEAALRLPLPHVQIPTLKLRVEIAAGDAPAEVTGLGNLSLTAWQNQRVAEATLTDTTPGDDLMIRLPRLPKTLVQVEDRGGERFVAIYDDPQLTPGKAVLPRRIAVAWDASGSSSAAGATRGRALLGALMRACPGLIIDLVVVRDRPEAAQVCPDAQRLDAILAGLPRDGATGLAALDLRRAALPHNADECWLLVGDGMGTWGEGIPACGDVPVLAVITEPVRDSALLNLLAARSGGMVVDLAVQTADQAAASLVQDRVALVRVDAAAGVLADVQVSWQGGRALVLARLGADGDASLVYRCNGSEIVHTTKPRLADALPGTVISRAWAGARAADLAVRAEANRGELLALGRTYGVVTAGTSLIVLESLDQYLRHGIQPPESLPDMKQQWLAAQKQRLIENGQRAEGQLARVERLWTERVAWWEQPGQLPRVEKPVAGWQGPPAPTAPAPVGTAAPSPAEDRDMRREEALADSETGDQMRRATAGLGGNLYGNRSGGVAKRALMGSADIEAKADIGSTIAIAPWNPNTPWLAALRAAPEGQAYAVYLEQRLSHADSPSFFLDCAGFLLARNRDLGIRVLSNLAELRLDDPALLRTLAWRLGDAGAFDQAVAVLRKVLRLRPEEPQSYRDLALALAARWDAGHVAADADEAVGLLVRVIMRRPLEQLDLGERWAIDANWDRFPGVEVIALEELNRLRARLGDKAPRVPEFPATLERNLDCDLRVVMAWDADATDIDLHVVQPDGEEAFYGHQRTVSGGLVSNDLTQGYGPEEYLLRRAPGGSYRLSCRYFGSRQQGLLGPATVTATVFLDWGRSSERCQRLTLRLDKQGDAIPIGIATVGGPTSPDGTTPALVHPVTRAQVQALAKGAERIAVERILGLPERVDSSGVTVLWYRLDNGNQVRIGFGPELLWAREVVSGAERDLLP